MNQNSEKRIKDIERQFIVAAIIDAPACVLVGLGLYAKFGANGNPFHPILNNDLVVNSMLIVGGLFMFWCGTRALKLAREKEKIKRKLGI